MATKTLAVRYRPKTFDDIVEQDNIKTILQQQLKSGEIKNAYLFCGPAGDGKTTTARIFANEINQGKGNPIEMDAASNSGVEDVRNISQQAQSRSLEAEYKVFIIDECHSISNTGWQALLKLIEEPPAKSIFIFCTTDPQKIPKTILSRVQRYDFQRISQQGIVNRLEHIINMEHIAITEDNHNALEYIAKLADGGMRDAITMMEKCLAFNTDLTLENIIKVLGTVDYQEMIKLTDAIANKAIRDVITYVGNIYSSGKDLKQFLKQYIQFLLDLGKYWTNCDWKYLNIPRLSEYEDWMQASSDEDFQITCLKLLAVLTRLHSEIKFSSTPKQDLEATLFIFIEGEEGI